MSTRECYCESYYRYTCPNCRESVYKYANRLVEEKCVTIEPRETATVLVVEPPLVTDGILEGEDG